MIATSLFAVLPLVSLARAHGCIWHPSMYGFNVTATNSPQYGTRDNRPQAPLKNLPFSQWWFHGHLDQPPHPNDVMELPAGGAVTTELACDKDATSYWPSGPGGNRQSGNDPCPGPPSKLIHANGINDLGGCALAIAYKSDANDVQPEDFVVFSVNHQCIWTRFTDFQVPANMPACPNGKCTCAWFWHHREDAGGDEMYMNGFQCNVTGATATTPIPQGKVPVRCVGDSSKCVKGAKQPFYWDQAERNNMFEDIYTPPLYLDSYGFYDGPQNDIWDTVGGSSGAAAKSSSSSSPSATPTPTPSVPISPDVPVAPTPIPETTSSKTSTSLASLVETTPHTSPAQTPAAASAPASTPGSTSTRPHATTTPGNVKAINPTPSSSSVPETKAKGGQGHRTCRPKKNNKSARALYNAARHRSRRARTF